MSRRALSRVGLATLIAVSAAGAFAAPATADSLPGATCVTSCVARFDTTTTHTFTVPAGVTSLTVQVAGGAGEVPADVLAVLTDAVGGPGGVATVELGGSVSSRTYDFGAGGAGQGSWLSLPTDPTPLVVAGGGGGAGYAGRLDLPDQIFATYSGGTGGVATTPARADGTAGTTPLDPAVNGAGSTGGTGSRANGLGGALMASAPGSVTLGAGGAGGSWTPSGRPTFVAGASGSGSTGGGGGGITSTTDGDGNPLDVVGAGAGGGGFLTAGLTATAGTPNTGTGYLTFTWSFSPTVNAAPTSVHPGDALGVDVAGLPAGVAFTLQLDGATIGSGTSDGAGAAHVAATVGAGQSAGVFPVELVVGSTVAAASSDVTVVALAATTAPTPTPSDPAPAAPALASTGSSDGPIATAAGALVLIGAMLTLVARRARTR